MEQSKSKDNGYYLHTPPTNEIVVEAFGSSQTGGADTLGSSIIFI